MTDGQHLLVRYRIRGDAATAHQRAVDIGLEQTVELPASLVPAGRIMDEIVGQVLSVDPDGPEHHVALIRYAVETTAMEVTQFFNVLFGNTSIKAGIRIVGIAFPPALLDTFHGPRFGIDGLRRVVHANNRALLCTALKPMGLSAAGLAELAEQMARGGLDVIKDDHGLSDQPTARFEERVRACAAAVADGNAKAGHHAVYAPNVTAPIDHVVERAHFAKANGAGALLLSPGLAGLDSLRRLASDPSIDLPILAHPALLGCFVTAPDNGIAHDVLFGTLLRALGADASIYPNVGGRFGFSRDECAAIAQACAAPMGTLPAIAPAPGGGMTLDRVADMDALYGRDVMYLIGGGLFSHGPDLVENCRHFRALVERAPETREEATP